MVSFSLCPLMAPIVWLKCHIHFPKNLSSHKLGGKPGVIYVIGLNINQSKVLWVSGPFPPGQFNDLQVFCQGLKDKMPVGKQAIADDGYKGEAEYIKY